MSLLQGYVSISTMQLEQISAILERLNAPACTMRVPLSIVGVCAEYGKSLQVDGGRSQSPGSSSVWRGAAHPRAGLSASGGTQAAELKEPNL